VKHFIICDTLNYSLPVNIINPVGERLQSYY